MASNTLLTSDVITREAQRILHQKLNFIGRVNRSYDDSFARSGAKIGDTLRIRLPTQYTVTDGAAIEVQDSEQQNTSLTVNNRKHVAMDFTDEELTLDIDNFSELHLEPAMAVLAANVESDMLENVYKDVYNQVNNVGSDITYKLVAKGRQNLVDNLSPMDNTVTASMNTEDTVDLNDAVKGLFNPQTTLSDQYREGMIGRQSGFTFFENTFMPRHATGTDDGTGDYLTDSVVAQTGTSLVIDGGTGTMTAGDVFTIAGVNRVHPETKVDTGKLQQFTVTTAIGASATSITFTPELIATGAKQNVTNGAANNQALTKVGGASAAHDISLGFHRDAFAFATADLEMPRGMDMASRKVQDGLSLRFVRGFDINNSSFVSRFDILYGFKTIRPQLAFRWANN
ncbi:MAG: P22 phage major capsid protein family protein [Thiotrichaceae bacterium]